MSVINVVTPVRNGESLIADTIESVAQQTARISGRAAIHHLVVDGASTDATVAIAKAQPNVTVLSEPDSGMYDALVKGFARLGPSDGVWAYLNAGDVWHPTAVDVVLDVLEERQDVSWLTGLKAAASPKGYIVNVSQPFAYRRRWLRSVAYGRSLPSVQQESTFWRGWLMDEIDLVALSKLRLAGDAYMWSCFSQVADLFVVNAMLGAFRMHSDHLSASRQAYLDEIRSFAGAKPRGARLLMEGMAWHMPDRAKRALAGRTMLSYRESAGDWASPSRLGKAAVDMGDAR